MSKPVPLLTNPNPCKECGGRMPDQLPGENRLRYKLKERCGGRCQVRHSKRTIRFSNNATARR